MSGIILAAIILPARGVGNASSIGWSWRDGRRGCGGVGVDLGGDGLGEEVQEGNGTDDTGKWIGMHLVVFEMRKRVNKVSVVIIEIKRMERKLETMVVR